MELAQLISGDWSRVWLAAHWDKKLKKQDYVEADVMALIESFLAKHSLLSLRATGHLLLGICKMLARKCRIFEEEAVEVRTRLMLAFSADGKTAEEGQDEGADAQLVLLPQADPERAVKRDHSTLLGGKRHMARLEDITLKMPALATEDAKPGSDDVFGAMSLKDLEAAMKSLPEAVLPMDDGLDGGFDTQPLVAFAPAEPVLGAEGAKPSEPAALDLAAPMPLDMDLAPMDQDLVPLFDAPSPPQPEPDKAEDFAPSEPPQDPEARIVGQEPAEAVVAGGGGGGELVAKRRRRMYFYCDEATEIPKETYQGFVNDRSAITRKALLDYSVMLPHYAPSLPSFTTTFTEMCPQLCEQLKLGTKVAEKRRRLLQEAEIAAGSDFARRAAFPLPVMPGAGEAQAAPAAVAAPALAPLAAPIEPDVAGLVSAELPAVESAGSQLSLMTESALLTSAPSNMGGVVTGSMDQEDQSESSAARVGYSVRTEKMHRFLAKEFKGHRAQSLSYEALCKEQAPGRRELIAGCFFELLVLRTNGVIGLQQEEPLADIRISKAAQFSK